MKLLGKTSFLKARENFLFFLYSILLYMKKLSNTVNHSNKLMLTYFFCGVFINLYFKTKHSKETFHLGFYSLSNVFSCRKHISSKSNLSVLTISGKKRNKKIIAPPPPPVSPPPHFIINAPILWYSLNIPWGSFYSDPSPFWEIFPEYQTPFSCLFDSHPLQLSTEEYTCSFLCNHY